MIIDRLARSLAELEAPAFVRSRRPSWVDTVPAPFQSRAVTLRPGEATTPHNHHDCEVWVILDGSGEVSEDGTVHAVGPGDAVGLEPLGVHALRNTATDGPLTFLTLWWTDLARLAAAHGQRSTVDRPGHDHRPVLLVPSFPTPNGDLHLGHLAGPYLAADACRRALGAHGVPAYLLLGTVGHQSQVDAAARARDVSFYRVAEENTDAILRSLAAAEVGWDVFVRPSSAAYPALARQVFDRLRETGQVVVKAAPANYCDSCQRYLFEAFVAGRCPHCGSADTAGIECEACALPFADSDLVDPACRQCGAPARHRELTRWFFPLEPHRDRLVGYLQAVAADVRLRGYLHRVLARPLPDLPVTVPTDEGIEVPAPTGSGTQRLYSAFELPARYLTALDGLAAGKGRTGWQQVAAEQPRTVLFFGFDNAYLRAFLFPAVLAAFTDAVPLPEALVCNEFYLLDGEKFSTGRGHAVWVREACTARTSDAVRLFLARTRPDVRRRSFSPADLTAFVRDELAGRWQPWLDTVGAHVRERAGGVAPEAGSWTVEPERFYGHIRELLSTALPAYQPDRFCLRTAAEAVTVFVDRARRFAESCVDSLAGPELDPVARTCVALELMAVRAVALAVAPLAPRLAQGLNEALGLPPVVAADRVPRFVDPGTPVRLPGGFFRVDVHRDVATAASAGGISLGQ